jgi:hypothetical protein
VRASNRQALVIAKTAVVDGEGSGALFDFLFDNLESIREIKV